MFEEGREGRGREGQGAVDRSHSYQHVGSHGFDLVFLERRGLRTSIAHVKEQQQVWCASSRLIYEWVSCLFGGKKK